MYAVRMDFFCKERRSCNQTDTVLGPANIGGLLGEAFSVNIRIVADNDAGPGRQTIDQYGWIAVPFFVSEKEEWRQFLVSGIAPIEVFCRSY